MTSDQSKRMLAFGGRHIKKKNKIMWHKHAVQMAAHSNLQSLSKNNLNMFQHAFKMSKSKGNVFWILTKNFVQAIRNH